MKFWERGVPNFNLNPLIEYALGSALIVTSFTPLNNIWNEGMNIEEDS